MIACPNCGHVRPARFSGQQQALIDALREADGEMVPYHVLAERMGNEGFDPKIIVKVQVCRMRRKADLPIVVVRGRGLRWTA